MSRNFLRYLLPVMGGLLAISGANAADLSWNGFGSMYYGQALSHDLLPANFQNNRPDFTEFSLFGLNVNAKLDDHWSAAAQLAALGDRNASANPTFATFAVQASWAYVAYKTEDGTQFRIGRQRFPIFSASEYIYEHFELPYRELPAIVFESAPFVAFDGASISHGFDTGIGKVNVQIFGGNPVLSTIPSTGVSAVITNLIGGRVNLEGDGWRVRGQASRSSTQSGVLQADSEYFSGGYRFDKYNIVSWGEYLYRHAADGTPQTFGNPQTTGNYLGDVKAGYVLGGYRIGAWMPRYTFAQASANEGTAGYGKTTTHTLGVNYQASEKVMIKAEYELTIAGPNGGFKTTPAGPTVPNSSNGSAVYAGVDFLM